MVRRCHICEKKVQHHTKFCPRCRVHAHTRREQAARTRALKAAWNKKRNGFICYYTGVKLEEKDRSSPWYISFDHRTPRKKGDLVVCARWVNSMKTEFSEAEFRAIIIELARCRAAGDEFNMSVAKFEFWVGPADQKPRKLLTLTDLRLPKIGNCIICRERTVPHSYYCPGCRHIVRNGESIRERTTAMQLTWDPVKKGFICHFTKLKVELFDRKDPRYITFDHRIPRQAGTLIVAVAFVNIMKSDLSEDEFWLVVPELADHFLTGKPFNRNIIKFRYWKRPKIARKTGK
jgi:hypothetical protein